MTFYAVIPVAKPRMTQSDKWKKRACVVRYWQFCDDIRGSGATLESGDMVTFHLPMPASWSAKKRQKMLMQAHKQTPDIDNLLKGLMDSLHKQDSHISSLSIAKTWSQVAGITISRSDKIQEIVT